MEELFVATLALYVYVIKCDTLSLHGPKKDHFFSKRLWISGSRWFGPDVPVFSRGVKERISSSVCLIIAIHTSEARN